MSKRSEIEKTLLKNIADLSYIKPDVIPNIDLYMDQVTTFMDEQLANAKRFDDDKILTKTMINNYAKDKILPPPVKKKYSREHMLFLIFIYYFKSILSISDMKKLLSPIADKYFGREGFNMESIYNEIFGMGREMFPILARDIDRKFKRSSESFMDVPEEERDMLQRFSLICMLSFDVYVKQMMINKLLDIETASPEQASEDKNQRTQKKGSEPSKKN